MHGVVEEVEVKEVVLEIFAGAWVDFDFLSNKVSIDILTNSTNALGKSIHSDF